MTMRIPARWASRDGDGRLGARRVDDPDDARRSTRSVLADSSTARRSGARRASSVAVGDAERAEGLGRRALRLASSMPPRAASSSSGTRRSPTRTAVQRAAARPGAPLANSAAPVVALVTRHRRHHLAFRGERHLGRAARSARRDRRCPRACAPRRGRRPRSGRPGSAHSPSRSCSCALLASDPPTRTIADLREQSAGRRQSPTGSQRAALRARSRCR